MSEVIKVHLGSKRPNEVEVVGTVEGLTEMWIYRGITTEENEDGNIEYVAEGVMIRTKLSEDEVLAQKNIYFGEIKPTEFEILEAQVLYTALITDTLLEE